MEREGKNKERGREEEGEGEGEGEAEAEGEAEGEGQQGREENARRKGKNTPSVLHVRRKCGIGQAAKEMKGSHRVLVTLILKSEKKKLPTLETAYVPSGEP